MKCHEVFPNTFDLNALKWLKTCLCGLMALLILSALSGPALAAGADDTAKKADALVRSAEKNMFNGKMEAALKDLEDANAQIEALRTADPQHRNLKSIEGKYNRIKTQVDKKVGKPSTTPSAATQAVPAAPGKADSSQLPAGVKKRLRDIERHLDNAERYVGKDPKQADYVLKQADELFREIDKSYAGQFDPAHPDYSGSRQRYDQLTAAASAGTAAREQAKADEGAARQMQEQQSAEWVERFRAYLSYPGQMGHNPDKLVFVPGTSEPEKFADAQKRYDEFKAFYESYQKTEFPHGKTWELEELGDRQAPDRVAQFESGFADRKASVSGDVDKELDQAMAQLEKDNGWTGDPSIAPPIVDGKWMKTMGENVEKAATALGGDPKADALRGKYAALKEKDQANRKIRTERTLCFPDIYKDKDGGELKKMAEAVVQKEKPGSRILRVSLYKNAWQEETVEEWTDTTKTARRIRTTRMINAHVAAKDGSGVFLHTLHIARDKQSDGWGNLYGHIMYSDPMLEANVKKDGVRK